jgi:hypothetical protein
MPRRESRPDVEAAPEKDPAADHQKYNGKGNGQPAESAAHSVGSRQVTWWFVHEHVEPLLAEVGSWPMVGTWEWHDLAVDDPRKLAAMFDAAQHWALRIETMQEAACGASHDVSGAANWSAIAQQKFRRDCAVAHGSYYIPRVTS